MALYTSNYLKQRALSMLENRIYSDRNKTYTSFDIFLSHSFLDKDVVLGLYEELRLMGFSVYVDWIIDPHLDRSNVTKESAELIQRRLKMPKTLLLAISTNAALSKWMPWELGVVDGNTNKCAIVPVSADNFSRSDFNRIEYLLLYPYIQPAEIERNKAYVVESQDRYVSMIDWIRHNSGPSYKTRNVNSL